MLCVLLVRDGRGFGDEACFRVSRPADGVDGVEGRSVIELCHGARTCYFSSVLLPLACSRAHVPSLVPSLAVREAGKRSRANDCCREALVRSPAQLLVVSESNLAFE